MLNAELRVVSGKQAGNVIPLSAGRFLIGREEDCHLRPGNDLVSRHHCVFKMDEYTVRVRDLGSTNGTFVNGERLRGEVMLNTGDKVRVGTLEFEVAIGEGAGEAEHATATFEGEPDTSQTIMQTEAPADAPETAEIAAYQGDTVYQPQPQYDPNQQQHQGYGQPMMGYQMPYPQYPYGQPYGMPMGYPQQPMPYPPMYPQQPMQMPPQPTPAPEPPATTEKRSPPPVTLPDPSQTGAKPPEPPAAGGEGSGQAPVSSTVNDIIKQYTQRRPGGTGK
jgi:pSer/pThr/pTyr-binding forkhead associated (FHA) protein